MTHASCLSHVVGFRHLGEGYKREAPSVLDLMERVNVFVLPMVDADGFDLTSAGERCTYDRAARPIASETGSKFNARRPLPKPVSAVKKFLTTHSIDAAMSLESEGIFVRMPPDDAEAFAGSGGRGDIRDESVILLAQAYFNVGITQCYADLTCREREC